MHFKRKLLCAAVVLLLANQNPLIAAESVTIVDPGKLVNEPFIRSLSSAVLYINTDNSWSIGPDVDHLVKVHLEGIPSVNDNTFKVSAIDAELLPNGNYVLFIEEDSSGDIYSVNLDAAGKVINYKKLTIEEIYTAEET